MRQCYACVQVQAFQTTCRRNKAQEETVISGMLKQASRKKNKKQRTTEDQDDSDQLLTFLCNSFLLPDKISKSVKHAKLLISPIWVCVHDRWLVRAHSLSP